MYRSNVSLPRIYIYISLVSLLSVGSGTRPSICIHPFDSSVCTRYHIRRRPGRRWSSEIERNRILRLQKRFDHKRTEFLSRLAGIISRGFERATIRLNSGLHVLENGDMYTNIYIYMGVYACRGMMQVWSCWSNESWKEWKRVEEARWLVVVLLSLSLLLLLMLLRHDRSTFNLHLRFRSPIGIDFSRTPAAWSCWFSDIIDNLTIGRQFNATFTSINRVSPR